MKIESHPDTKAGQDRLRKLIADTVDDVWELYRRDDLKADCIDYGYRYYNWVYGIGHTRQYHILAGIIAFLSEKCADAMSEADVDAMAIEESDISFNSYEDATSGV